MRKRDAVLIERAAERRSRMTPAEARLWSALRNRQPSGAKFSRQIAIAGCICDFVRREHRLIIEVDGSQHFESDKERDARLRANRYRILRFWNAEGLESFEHVLYRIASELPERPPQPLPVGEGSFTVEN
jgi:very-short-patch-repair endonuclease